MRTFLILWKRELAAYFLSPIAYVMMMFFLAVMGYTFWMLLNILAHGVVGATVMNELFGSIFFWITLLILIPLITMRLLAEENRSGTIELLMTAPVTEAQVVLAKYAGALSFYFIMWMPTLAYVYVLRRYDPLMSVDLGPLAAGYLGALLLGAFYLSAGLLMSALTRNQIVAAMSAFAMVTLAFFAGFMPYISRSETVRDAGRNFSAVMHMMDFSRGMVDTRPAVLYLTGAAFLLFTTVKILEMKKWK
ncbi:MAG TPA: ABC transporter permease [Kiritimatiellia bacterium]|nr:ABC transporter permease [Kiritimatiellia bacterium]HNS80170.1 ABC transporter permease [Kiritimatiellia bacterium]HPA77386.1 ABC transporter permease [Kiritimatiellia bacterium]HQQ03866.1 ABC transporter permease [Kiritimatiellia bacterium]